MKKAKRWLTGLVLTGFVAGLCLGLGWVSDEVLNRQLMAMPGAQAEEMSSPPAAYPSLANLGRAYGAPFGELPVGAEEALLAVASQTFLGDGWYYQRKASDARLFYAQTSLRTQDFAYLAGTEEFLGYLPGAEPEDVVKFRQTGANAFA